MIVVLTSIALLACGKRRKQLILGNIKNNKNAAFKAAFLSHEK